MMLEVSKNITTGAKTHDIRTLLRGKLLSEFLHSMWDDWKLSYQAYKLDSIGFRYKLYPDQCIVKAKAHDAPKNEEAAQTKNQSLFSSYDKS